MDSRISALFFFYLRFLLSELSSQFGRNLVIVQKRLPPGFHYFTGEPATIRENINPFEPIPIVQSVTGNIIAVIDRMGYIRRILNPRNQSVQLVARRNYQAILLDNRDIRRYKIEFDVMRPLPQSDSKK